VAQPSLRWPGRLLLIAVLIAGTGLAAFDPITLVFFVLHAGVGAFLIVRRPRNTIGWLLLAIAFGFIGTTTPPGLDVAALARGDGTARDIAVGWINSWSGTVAFVGYLALTILFPSGRLPVGRWRRPAIAVLAVGILVVLLGATAPTVSFSPDGVNDITIQNPVAVPPGLPIWDLPLLSNSIVVVIPLMLAGVASMLVRYRRSTGLLRLQLRWLVAAVAFVAGAVVFGLGTLVVVGPDALFAWIPAIVAYPTVPIAIGIAVMRYRLYEIDRIISRTICWAVVRGLLVGAFVLLVLGLTSVVEPLTGGNTLAIAGSTLLVAALFQPVRSRVQRAVDRRFDQARYDGQRLLAAFGERLRDEVDPPTIRSEVLTTVDAAVRPAGAGLWLRRPDAEGGA